MNLFLKVLACELVGLLAPFVTLFYRGGWFNTPDDAVAPRGLGEPAMRARLAKWGVYWSDWWWLGVRNRAYGLRYLLKPELFKGMVYERLKPIASDVIHRHYRRRKWGWVRKTRIFGCSEWAIAFLWKGEGVFHILYGYRMTPIFNEVYRNAFLTGSWDVPYRPINMDARPILSVRSGAPD